MPQKIIWKEKGKPKNLSKAIDKQAKAVYNNNRGTPMTVASLVMIKDNRYVWKTGRLSFFVIETGYNGKYKKCNLN